MSIRGAVAGELDELARFVAWHQARRESTIAFFGRSAKDVAAEIRSWDASWFDRCLVAERHGEIVGFVGVDGDGELGRAWIHGPVVDADAWDALADELLERCIDERIADDARDLELAGDVANARLAELARRHGFERRTPSRALEIGREAVSRLAPGEVPPLEPAQHEELVALHDRLFPATYYSGRQLVEQHGRGEATVLALVEASRLTGYAAGRSDATGEGYVDFVGVDEPARGAGRGRRLVTAICRCLLEQSGSKVALTVYEDNLAALALYDRLGFEVVASIVGYRRRLGRPAAGEPRNEPADNP